MTMSVAFELNAEPRHDMGKGASRRLRRQGRVPAVLYGADKAPETLSFVQHDVLHQLGNEAFYSHILQVNIGSRKEQAILRDLQRHPYKPMILHMDLQRVTADEKVRVHVPLHFINEDIAPGVKQQSGAISHFRIEVEVSCLPKDLPEFIEVDLVELPMGEAIHLSQLKLPAGVEIVELSAEHDVPVVSIHGQRAEVEEKEIGAGEETPAEVTGA
jgi:large subunit ribosomal protein L25